MADDKQIETWTYAGRRVKQGGKAYIYAWIDPSGRMLYYAKLKASLIGGTYAIEVTRDGEATRASNHATWTGDRRDDGEVEGWTAEDAAAQQNVEGGKAERRAADDDAVQDALDVLRRHFTSCKSYSAKWAFAQWVAGEVARPPRNRTDAGLFG